MKEWQRTLIAVSCITVITVAGAAAYSGHMQSTKGMPDAKTAALQACQDSLRDKYMRDVLRICVEQGFITTEQARSAPL